MRRKKCGIEFQMIQQQLAQLMQNPQTAENPDIQNEFTRIQLEIESRKAIRCRRFKIRKMVITGV